MVTSPRCFPARRQLARALDPANRNAAIAIVPDPMPPATARIPAHQPDARAHPEVAPIAAGHHRRTTNAP
jgi:hypothetical protein